MRKVKSKNDDVRIELLTPHKEFTDFEKTAILQFRIEQEEGLSKTQKFKALNSKIIDSYKSELPKEKNNNDFDLPKKKTRLSDTVRLKISDLRAALDNQEKAVENNKKSLYDTVIIKLDDLINKKNALKFVESKKVTSVDEPKKYKKSFYLFKPKMFKDINNIHINVDSEEFGKQLYNINKVALINLSNLNTTKVRKYSNLSKLERIDKIKVSKKNYDLYQSKLNKFAINKLYYKFAPKESGKYKIYKYSVLLTSFIFVATLGIIVNWAYQGISINNLSNSLQEDTVITKVNDGELYNITTPIIEENGNVVETPSNNQTSMYWKYLNTPLSSVDFTSLLEENSDTVGWLIVNNTNVNYPVVQTTNNDYYLSHDFNKNYNNAGWVYADFRDNFNNFNRNTVIYAHGRKDKVMFGSLTNTLNSNWYTNEDNQIIQLSTLKYNTMWQIFSIYKVEAESYYITTDFSSDDNYINFLNIMKSRSIYDFGIDLSSRDKIITLSTCYNDNGIRLVVQAKLVKIQER